MFLHTWRFKILILLNKKNIQGLPVTERVNYGFVKAITLMSRNTVSYYFLLIFNKFKLFYTFSYFKRRFYFIICILSNNILHPCHPARLALEDNGFLGIIQVEFIFLFVMYKTFSIL
jgi:hypothetical protein